MDLQNGHVLDVIKRAKNILKEDKNNIVRNWRLKGGSDVR
jgi:hypothetical protein